MATQITKFDRENLKEARRVIDVKLKEAAAELGINISIGNIRFESNQFTTRLTANTKAIATPGTLTKMLAPGTVFAQHNVKAGMTFKHKNTIYTVYQVNAETVYARTQRQAPSAAGYRLNYKLLNTMSLISSK
jgi:hypothetical protein